VLSRRGDLGLELVDTILVHAPDGLADGLGVSIARGEQVVPLRRVLQAHNFTNFKFQILKPGDNISGSRVESPKPVALSSAMGQVNEFNV
jgi:hypothetical protein